MSALLTTLSGMMTQDLYEEVKAKLIPAVKDLKKGDPKDEGVFIGPLIAEKEAQRVESWVQDAISKGGLLSPYPTHHSTLEAGEFTGAMRPCALPALTCAGVHGSEACPTVQGLGLRKKQHLGGYTLHPVPFVCSGLRVNAFYNWLHPVEPTHLAHEHICQCAL
jgi:hypothetical protein